MRLGDWLGLPSGRTTEEGQNPTASGQNCNFRDSRPVLWGQEPDTADGPTVFLMGMQGSSQFGEQGMLARVQSCFHPSDQETQHCTCTLCMWI